MTDKMFPESTYTAIAEHVRPNILKKHPNYSTLDFFGNYQGQILQVTATCCNDNLLVSAWLDSVNISDEMRVYLQKFMNN